MVADMGASKKKVVDMVADMADSMEVHMVADMEVNKVDDMASKKKMGRHGGRLKNKKKSWT